MGRAAKPLRESQWREADREVVEEAGALLERIGRPTFEARYRAGFRWWTSPHRPIERWSEWQPDPNLLIQDKNADILKGLAWLCAGRRRRGRASSDSAGALGVSEGAAGGSGACGSVTPACGLWATCPVPRA